MNDSDLRNLFHRLREEETRFPPSPRMRGEGAPKGRMRGWAFAIVAILIVIGVALRHERTPTSDSILTWKPPTDVLLLTPGSELLTTVPRIPDLPERK
ncbi:MAG: hypothetical protein AABO58_21570 [Acidobacteriota bacterium]